MSLNTDLPTNISHAFADPATRDLDDGFGSSAGGVAVYRNAGAAFAAQELIERDAKALGFDVPKRGIDSAKGIHQHRAIAPIRTLIHRLPYVFDIVRVFAGEERCEIFVYRCHHRANALSERGAADAVKAGFAGLDFHHAKACARRSGEVRLDLGDLERAGRT